MSFTEEFDKFAKDVYKTAKSKGWWETEGNDGEKISLMHSELSECLDALRHGNPPDDHIPDYSGAEAELADTIIRIMDFAEARNLRLSAALVAKAEYNKTRAYKHGNKKF